MLQDKVTCLTSALFLFVSLLIFLFSFSFLNVFFWSRLVVGSFGTDGIKRCTYLFFSVQRKMVPIVANN